MAKDIAPRDLDLAGFRISGLGDPQQTGDATRTDNVSVPRRSFDTGASGASLLAAAADHVHPETGSVLSFSDSIPLLNSEALRENWWAVIDFDNFVGDTVQIELSGMLLAAVLEVWLDGVLLNPSAGTLVMNISTDSETFVPVAGTSSAPFPKPSGPHLLTMTNRPFFPGQVSRTFARTIIIRGRFNRP